MVGSVVAVSVISEVWKELERERLKELRVVSGLIRGYFQLQPRLSVIYWGYIISSTIRVAPSTAKAQRRAS